MRRLLPVAAWGLITLLGLFLVLRHQSNYVFGASSDDSKYFLLARSFVRAEPYAAHFGPQETPLAYPFLLPLLLAPFVALFPEAPGAGACLSLATTLLNSALIFWGWPLLSGLHSRWWALAAASAYMLSPLVVAEAQMIASDPPFTTIALLVLLLSEAAARRQRPGVLPYVALGFLAAAGTFMRTAGAILWPTLALRLWWRWRRQSLGATAALLLGAALLVLPALAHPTLRLGNLLPSRYVTVFRDPSVRGYDPAEISLPTRIGRGITEYGTRCLRELLVPVGGDQAETRFGERLGVAALPRITGAVVTGVVLAGAVWSLGGALAPSVLLFELFQVAVVLSWFHREPRFLYPILPFLALQLLLGARLIAASVIRRVAPTAPRSADVVVVALAVLLAAGAVYRGWHGMYVQTRNRVGDLAVGPTWLRQHSAPGDLVLADLGMTMHVYSDRPILTLPPLTPATDVPGVIRENGVRWVLVTPKLEWNSDGRRRYADEVAAVLIPALENLAAQGRVTLAYESPPDMVRVYRVEP